MELRLSKSHFAAPSLATALSVTLTREASRAVQAEGFGRRGNEGCYGDRLAGALTMDRTLARLIPNSLAS